MSKVRIYISPGDIAEEINVSDKEIIHKIRNVLSLESNENIYIFDGAGKEYSCSIKQIAKNNLLLLREKIMRFEPDTRSKLKLAVPLIKEQKVELILQKATELGIGGFIPFMSERSIREKPSLVKIKRWNKIIQEAARQSEQLWIPEIDETVDFDSLIKKDFSLKLAASIEGENINKLVEKNVEKILVMVGPEGDFSPLEYKKLKASGFRFLNLSKNILRVETACIVCVGLIKYFLD